ncbi:166L [Cherax quadricarinatus iridovirus]|uniref:2'-5' RNA ligase n=1 Tax=Shrimp hemocyte iridescent virus TaxID=2039780 RepID=A0A291B115_9VIRU|nr:166L [Cherax quadricarinatus iridovirus]YP_010084913.1 hypothetical protein KM509_gp161 [Shrimp hemocyte iridescent virus]ASZ85146.1 166L [Cherax quadricarinatus iridovirus]ATE87170.1 hypothetical protein [Shrimp hemocyte iridescent virus]UPA43742.1 hypothetical protein 1DG000150 [Iridovirus CN01]
MTAMKVFFGINGDDLSLFHSFLKEKVAEKNILYRRDDRFPEHITICVFILENEEEFEAISNADYTDDFAAEIEINTGIPFDMFGRHNDIMVSRLRIKHAELVRQRFLDRISSILKRRVESCDERYNPHITVGPILRGAGWVYRFAPCNFICEMPEKLRFVCDKIVIGQVGSSRYVKKDIIKMSSVEFTSPETQPIEFAPIEFAPIEFAPIEFAPIEMKPIEFA